MASFFFNWTLLCICIGIVFLFLGHPSPVFYALGIGQEGAQVPNPDGGTSSAYGGKPIDIGKMVGNLGNILVSPTSLFLLIALAVGGLIPGAAQVLQQGTSFAAFFLVPLFIYLFIMNYVVMPWSMFFVNSNCPGVESGSLTPEQTAACQTATFPVISIPNTDVGINIQWPILLLFNFFTVQAAISFIRGG